MCPAKKYGGLGFKNALLWNTIVVGKQIWVVMAKAENLWVKLVFEVYLRGSDLFEYHISMAAGWHWNQLVKVRDRLKNGFFADNWLPELNGVYTLQSGYKYLLGEFLKCRYAQVVWNRFNQPEHSFFLCLVLQGRLLTLDRLAG